MIKNCLALVLALACVSAGTQALAANDAALLPDLPGFERHGEVRTFDADSLYEYVNGDAFTYMGFRFEALKVQDYADGEDRTVTVELFRHRDAKNGYGIYSYERLGEAKFLEVGGQGYFENGKLNFFKGPYYVKLIGSGLGDAAEATLSELARLIAERIEGKGGLPAAAESFPPDGLGPDSIRFVGADFLGHRFLHSAFVARYRNEAGELQAFILDPADPGEVRGMLEGYLEFLDKKGVEPVVEKGVYRFRDPYNASEGLLHLKPAGGRMIGVFSDDPAKADALLSKIAVALEALPAPTAVAD
jgi:hypothetical protein